METLFIIFFFIIGAILGSFFHVVGTRLPIGENLIKPRRSYCPSCHSKLGFFDLIPILSYVFLKGKCKYCKKKISISYPIIEIITGLLFAVSYKIFGFTPEFIISLILSGMVSIIIISDTNYLIIPDSIIITSIILILSVLLIFKGITTTLISIAFGIAMFIIMYLIMLLGNFMFKKESLGGADIKLMFVSGLSVGLTNSLFVIFLASFLALPISIILLIKNKEKMIPFGPFIAISILIIFMLNMDIYKFLEDLILQFNL